MKIIFSKGCWKLQHKILSSFQDISFQAINSPKCADQPLLNTFVICFWKVSYLDLLAYRWNFNFLASLCSLGDWFESVFFKNLEDRFLHRCLFMKLFTPIVKWMKIHVQIMRFTCRFNMGLNLKILKMSPALFAWCYIRKALQYRLIISPMFCSRKCCVRLWPCNVQSTQPAQFWLREIQCKKMDNLMFKQRFQCELGWNKVKYARITITHVWFIAITLAGSLGRFEHSVYRPRVHSIPWTRQMFMHEKTCDPYICASQPN